MTETNITNVSPDDIDDMDVRANISYLSEGTYTLGRATGHRPYVFADVAIESGDDGEAIVYNVEFGGGIPQDLAELRALLRGLADMLEDEGLEAGWAAEQAKPAPPENEPVSADGDDNPEEQA